MIHHVIDELLGELLYYATIIVYILMSYIYICSHINARNVYSAPDTHSLSESLSMFCFL